MHLIYESLKKTGGKADGEALIEAAKGMKWESPRGPMSIDPETRDVVRDIYILRVEMVGGKTEERRIRQGQGRQGPGQGADEEETMTAKSATATSFPGRTPDVQQDDFRKIPARTWSRSPPCCLLAAPAVAQDTIKIGLILPYSGQFADAATQMDNAIKLYVKQHGDTVAGKKIEFIRKDTGGIAPDVAKRLAQELVVRDKVDILAGFVLTPNALAAGDISSRGEEVHGGHERRDLDHHHQVALHGAHLADHAAAQRDARHLGGYKSGVKQGLHHGVGLRPRPRRRRRVPRARFKEAGGEIVGSVRFPVANPDFSAFVQRAKDLNPEAIYIWVPGGAQPAAIGKALAERGIDPQKTKMLGQGELTDDEALKSMGDAALGIITAFHYDYDHDSAMNKEFVQGLQGRLRGRNPDIFSIGGYDGMHLIYEALKKTGGKTDGEALIAAAKGMKWESPRGPISIDPETRDIVQTVYIRRVEKVGGKLVNVEFDKIENVKDPVKAAMKK